MIDNAAWKNILATATDISTVCEIYDSDAVPGDDGFDPNDAIGLYAAVAGITFRDCDYTQLVTSFDTIKRTMTKEANTASVTFSNVNRTISRFEFNNGFEGLIMVIRVISRSQSDSLDNSQILFSGRCDKPTSGSKDSLSVSASWVLGGPEVQIPRRKYTDYDQEGRTPTDPEFEGFPFMPQYGTSTYSTRERKGGILGVLGFKKTVWHTLQYSSHSDLDANKDVAEILGQAQVLASHIAYEDVDSSTLHGRSAVCEGEIYGITNIRSVTSLYPLIADESVFHGKVGAVNSLGILEASGWPGNPDGTHYYSRTAGFIWHTGTDDVTVDDPAPDIACLVQGRLMTVPDGTGAWVTTGQFSNNGAAHARWLMTDDKYLKIDESWLADDDFTESFNICDELILLRTASDLVLLVAG